MQPNEQQPDPRADLDAQLQISEWRLPSRRPAVATEPGAPSWWRGEEEASEAFLREMGVRFGPNGEVIRNR